MILKNIEIKARITDFTKTEELVEQYCGKPIEVEYQEDTFFNIPKGRLKFRETIQTSAIMYYDRPNSFKPKQSDIAISFTDEPETLKFVLSKSLGIRGIVNKKRTLYKYGQTRIHLDDVADLGKFIELEVVLNDGQSIQYGENIAKDLMIKFNIHKNDLIDVAYIDLLEKSI